MGDDEKHQNKRLALRRGGGSLWMWRCFRAENTNHEQEEVKNGSGQSGQGLFRPEEEQTFILVWLHVLQACSPPFALLIESTFRSWKVYERAFELRA